VRAVEEVASQLRLRVIGPLAGGERGATAVTASDGTESVLKTYPLDEYNRLVEAQHVASVVRGRGVPVPDPSTVGTTSTRAYALQRRCAGDLPIPFTDDHARQLLEYWDAFADAIPNGSDYPERVVRALQHGDRDLYAVHEPLREGGTETTDILERIIGIGSDADASLLRRTDAMHGDFHHRNLLVDGATVTAIIDWESARAGDARYDLVLLDYWTHVYEGSGVDPQASARVRTHTDASVEPRARRLLAALVALHQLWFVTAFRRERVAETLENVERHLVPHWNS
jgi:aminoglycoside phosphotransferase (APT) family kinase protein